MTEEQDPKRFIQSVVVELSDGRKGVFSGPPLIWSEKEMGRNKDHEVPGLTIEKMYFREPVLLSEGAYWEKTQEDAFQKDGDTPENPTIDAAGTLRARIQDKLKERTA